MKLSPRERQITDLLLRGHRQVEIAKLLKISRHTVKAHFNRMYMRAGITSGVKQVKLAVMLYEQQEGKI